MASLKTVLLAPLAKPASLANSLADSLANSLSISSMGGLGAQPDLPTYANVSASASLHDHHNLEIKTISEIGAKPSVVETDFYLFVPKSFEVAEEGKEELLRDFRSRLRIALPVEGEQGVQALENALVNLSAKIAQLEACGLSESDQSLDLDHALSEETLEAAKDVSAVLSETLKHRSYEHTRQFLLSHTLMTLPQAAIAGLEQFIMNLESTALMMISVRKRLESKLPTSNAVLNLLDEYVSHLYVQYLSIMRSEFLKIAIPKSCYDDLAYSQTRLKTERLLDRLQQQEAEARCRFGKRFEDEDDLGREHRLVRLSHLKKFFQSKTFIDVTRHRSAKKVSSSTATIGTAAAAVIAALIERFSRPEIGDAAYSGFVVVVFGVIFYVLRDRLKDWAKTRFQETALQYLPDFEQQLLVKDKKIGRMREWFRILKKTDLPLDVRAGRRGASASEMEKRLPEDVFHCRKVLELQFNEASGSRALYENTRINVDRYLKHMDDPFKEFADLDLEGRFTFSKSHRVYHFYLCVKTKSRPQDADDGDKSNEKTTSTFYRIVIDKSGLVRLENL